MLTSILFQALLAAAPAPSGSLFVECPPTFKDFCGTSIDPSVTGLPTVVENCDDSDLIDIDYVDVVVPATCPSQRFIEVIYRTFTVTDGCGNTATCTQELHIIKRFANFDLHPRSCPNPFNRTGGGVYPAAIVGSSTLDVTQIDPNSIEISLKNCVNGTVSPIRWALEDVVTAYSPQGPCACTTAGPDGILDLTLKFDKVAMKNALGLAAFPNMSFVEVVVTGNLLDGCPFIGLDCVRVQ